MAKTLFKSSEDSNFILNMTEEQYSKLASVGLVAACFTTSISAVIPEVFDDNTYSVCATGLAVSGVICLVLALIAIIKKYVRGRAVLPAIAFAGMLAWGGVSLFSSYDRHIGFYGFPQRGEGILALMFYFGVFVTAASVKRKKAVNALLIGIIGAGLLNSVWAVIQIFTGKLMFYSYTDISVVVMAVAPAGLAQSPIFLAMLLTLSLTAALVMATTGESERSRALAMLCGCLFAFVMVFTRTVAGIAGVIIGLAAGAAALFIAKKPKERLTMLLMVLVAAGIGIGIAGTAKSGTRKGYRLCDGYILWSDDSYQRVSASGNYRPTEVDIEDSFDVYSFLNKETIDIIKRYPLEGTGPEQLVYPQIYTYGELRPDAEITELASLNAGTFDKTYNEYLYTAATRGIPSMILLMIILAAALRSGYVKLKENADTENTAAFMLTLSGVIVFLIGCSNITFSPVLWACAGIACAELPVKERSKPAKKKSDMPEKPAKNEAPGKSGEGENAVGSERTQEPENPVKHGSLKEQKAKRASVQKEKSKK